MATKLASPRTAIFEQEYERDDSSEDVDPLEAAVLRLQSDRQFLEYSPRDSQLLGFFSVACLFINRTLGSGVFAAPAIVLEGTRSLGISLLLWVLGGVVALCTLLVWLEFGLSVPLQPDSSGQKRNAPKNGGELNFFQYLFPKHRLLATCAYGVMFLLVANLAGNALYIGHFTMLAIRGYKNDASGLGPGDGPVVGIAICAITLSVLMHVWSRRGGILLNNLFAIVKVLLVLLTIILGFTNLGYSKNGWDTSVNRLFHPNMTMIHENFDNSNTFRFSDEYPADGRSIIQSFLYVTYANSGYLQCFYVLAEVATPKATVPKATFAALGLTTVLFILMNISYWLVLPVREVIEASSDVDIAELFFTTIFGDEIGRKVMCSLVVISVFGNLLTVSFVAGRVKQEIAKAGILPFARFFAQSRETPWAWLKQRFSNHADKPETERAPITGLFLHWISTMICIIATAWMHPLKAYTIWVTLYGFAIRLQVPIIVSGGLLYLKLNKSCNWKNISAYNCGLIPAVTTFSVLMVVFWNGFAKPAVDFTVVNPNYILPLIALTSWLWGILWWVGIRAVERLRKEEMVSTITAYIEPRKNGEYVQVAEIVEIEWVDRFQSRVTAEMLHGDV